MLLRSPLKANNVQLQLVVTLMPLVMSQIYPQKNPQEIPRGPAPI
jgi:hypothetical protein